MTDLMIRKLLTTFVVTTSTSILFSLSDLPRSDYSIASHLVWNDIFYNIYFYNMYIGAIIFIYGNAVSLAIEWARCKWFSRQVWLGIGLHAFWGMGLGVVIKSWIFLLIGMLIALAYGVLDWWLEARMLKQKRVAFILLLPVVLYAVAWAALYEKAPSDPSFTMEEAVAFVVQGGGTDIQVFPDHIGIWHGTIDSYRVVRETSAGPLDENRYIVTFSETWRKGKIINSRHFSYQVERDSMTFYSSEGDSPPYDRHNIKE
ncbi:hypothetical protein [Paenibacillus sinopodophylli]|uniref:hypothetical protein n=1 Tax=Paenibacillus sinopodophylli TaxID=1837342 RepID=UPI00110CC5E8|nr:hypothetical protein [Paenibacillus sinopodophylli]